jgi:hypothetical protein
MTFIVGNLCPAKWLAWALDLKERRTHGSRKSPSARPKSRQTWVIERLEVIEVLEIVVDGAMPMFI